MWIVQLVFPFSFLLLSKHNWRYLYCSNSSYFQEQSSRGPLWKRCLWPEIWLKIRLWHRCFPVLWILQNFWEHLFLWNTTSGCFCTSKWLGAIRICLVFKLTLCQGKIVYFRLKRGSYCALMYQLFFSTISVNDWWCFFICVIFLLCSFIVCDILCVQL